ncbi:MAG TPA: HEAT repeat domain-containing protein [Isosphaeraceae bacterium]
MMRRGGGSWAVALVLGMTAGAHADQILLRGGGQIRGVVVPDPARPEHVLVQTETGPAPIAFRKEQVESILAEPGPLDEYLARRLRVEATAQAQYDLGLWCEARKLTGPATIHYRRAVELDKDFGPAHKKLGHVRYKDRWLTYDELREAQGLIKYKGRWVTREEKQQSDDRDAAAAERTAWARRLLVYREALLSGREDARHQAELDLIAIRDPAAVEPLVEVLGQQAGPLRSLLVQALGGIPGPEATAALTDQLFAEPDSALREVILDELARRHEPETVPRLMRALGHANPRVVGRAAWALGHLEAVAAVPKLIPALVSERRRIVWVPSVSVPAPRPGVGFGSVAPVPGVGPGSLGPGPYVPVLTGPVVAPGVIAFGATSVPLSTYAGSGLSVGQPQQPSLQPRLVRTVSPNPEVLEALQRLTGQNFYYDRATWRRWLRTSRVPEPEPVRSVPQP